MIMGRVGAVGIGAVLVLAGCGGDAPPPTPTGSPPTRTPPSDTVPTESVPTESAPTESVPTDTAPPEEQPDPAGVVTLAFAGDIHFEDQLRARLDDPDTALGPLADKLSAADLAVVNLESAVGTTGTPEPKRFTFQAPPVAFDALAAAGVDVVTMANNHAMDFGPDGFAETLAAASARRDQLSVVGIGVDQDEAFAPALHDVDGTRVAVLGASTPDDPTADPTDHWAATADDPGIAVALDPAPLLDAVTTARDDADVVVVYMHWGVQGESCPSQSQQQLAGELAAAGADVVVGSHAHRLQGAGLVDDGYVAYGLGNAVWYRQGSAEASATGVLTVTVNDGEVVDEQWAPATIGADGVPEFADGDDAQQMIDDFHHLRDCADVEPLPDR
ncbi:CapA family protein [Phytoactinopolyspora limicola]|uniref:CapA family protein n=1 Tax=Phytoactinopolyspora limicola TaxID=2715536 RepID=UPI0014073BD5|nr:CapA family protein [Phytoactinopolyspora limicola]